MFTLYHTLLLIFLTMQSICRGFRLRFESRRNTKGFHSKISLYMVAIHSKLSIFLWGGWKSQELTLVRSPFIMACKAGKLLFNVGFQGSKVWNSFRKNMKSCPLKEWKKMLKMICEVNIKSWICCCPVIWRLFHFLLSFAMLFSLPNIFLVFQRNNNNSNIYSG